MDNISLKSTPSSKAKSREQTFSECSIRQKKDITWKYIDEGTKFNGKKVPICGFCQKQIIGRGINKMKQYLVGEKCNVDPCKKVTRDV